MAIKGFMESSLAHSEVFNGINKQMKVQDRAINLIKTARHLTNEDIEGAYISVKQITDTLTKEAMKAFDDERIVLVYNDVPKLSITQALPFITLKVKARDDYVTYVFVDKYINKSRDGVLSMQAPILRDLLTAAVISNGLKRNYQALSTNQYLQKTCMEIYCKLFCRVLNREFSIAADKAKMDTIQYWVNKFFLLQIFGAADTPENIETLSKAHVKYLDEIGIEEMKNKYNEVNPMDISGLLELVQTASPRMKTLKLGLFLNDWINYYYIPSMLAVDNIEYMLFMCITLLAGNNIINIGASDIVKDTKNIKSFRGELLKLI